MPRLFRIWPLTPHIRQFTTSCQLVTRPARNKTSCCCLPQASSKGVMGQHRTVKHNILSEAIENRSGKCNNVGRNMQEQTVTFTHAVRSVAFGPEDIAEVSLLSKPGFAQYIAWCRSDSSVGKWLCELHPHGKTPVISHSHSKSLPEVTFPNCSRLK